MIWEEFDVFNQINNSRISSQYEYNFWFILHDFSSLYLCIHKIGLMHVLHQSHSNVCVLFLLRGLGIFVILIYNLLNVSQILFSFMFSISFYEISSEWPVISPFFSVKIFLLGKYLTLRKSFIASNSAIC